MTAEEIRRLSLDVQNQGLATTTVGAHQAGMLSAIVSMLGEIAAQLAEINEHLVKIANPPIVYITQKQPELSLDDFKKPR